MLFAKRIVLGCGVALLLSVVGCSSTNSTVDVGDGAAPDDATAPSDAVAPDDASGVDACTNGKKDGTETDTDCGGTCTAKCKQLQGCAAPSDCVAGLICSKSVCVPQSATDGVKNGTETDVDCGGNAAPPCATGKGCAAGTDCVSTWCNAGVCKVPTSSDGIKNGTETDIDCGGGAPTNAPRCPAAAACLIDGDCAGNVRCTGGVCQPPTKTDGLKNGTETDIDCGGGAPTSAPRCPAAAACAIDGDCAGTVRCTGLVCQPPTSTDGLQNGTETDVDCGGGAPTNALRCATGKKCAVVGDCNKVLCTALVCAAPTSTDGIKNGTETDIDCGGGAPTNAPRCATGKACVATADCNNVLCDVGATNLCLAPTHVDGLKNGDETGVDCGGPTAPNRCATGQGCAANTDCNNAKCDVGATNLCLAQSSTDGIKNGTETDIDCGGGPPTNAPACGTGKTCAADGDCASTGCNYLNKCVESRSCKAQHGGDTCGPAGNESCCKTLPAAGLPAGTVNGVAVATSTIDKYNITAGRMRQFVTATNGNMRGWVQANTPAWWNASWTNWLPSQLDSGATNPDCGTAAACGVYSELGPYVHAPGAVGANEGCYIRGNGARTYRIPDATNTAMSDDQLYAQNALDERSMNCVTVYILAAFCAWDGAHLPTRGQLDHVWGAHTYPWGSDAATGSAAGGSPLGYEYAADVDPQNGVRGSQPNLGVGYGGRGSYGPYEGAPYTAVPTPFTAAQLLDLQYANYNFNYWGGLTQLRTAIGNGMDQTLFIAPPGRFPNGNGPYGHADLAGNVFNAVDINTTNAYWSRSGSWQGHPVPWAPPGGNTNFSASHKYWAMGGRCAR